MLRLDGFAAATGARTRRRRLTTTILSRQGGAVLRRRRRRGGHAGGGRRRSAVLVLLGEQVLQPPVLHLQLGDARLEGGVQLVGVADRALERLLALLLLDAESSAGGRVAASLVLLDREPGLLLEAEGARDALPGRHRAVLVVADLAVGRRDRGRHVRRRVVAGSMAQLIDLIRDRGIDGWAGIWKLVGKSIMDRLVTYAM